MTYTDSNFPSTWDPRYTLFQGLMADPDRRENWSVRKSGPRVPATEQVKGDDDFYVNPKEPVGITPYPVFSQYLVLFTRASSSVLLTKPPRA